MPGSGRHTHAGSPPLTTQRKKDLSVFQRGAGLKFRSLNLLNLALTHRSYANESPEPVSDNERLEFLGDSVLGLVISEHLYRDMPDKPEGELAKIKAHLVSERTLADIARTLGIGDCVIVGRGEENTGGRRKKALLSDCLEALIGAYYLDTDIQRVRDFILQSFFASIQAVKEGRHDKDYKTLLQELSQKLHASYPKYSLEKQTGPDHEKTYWISVTIHGDSWGPGQGRTKKVAEQAAARLAYTDLLSSTDSTE